MVRKKHIPQRTCIACRKVKAKQDLIRIVRTSSQTLLLDETGKAQGRGAYLCKESSCWNGNGFSKGTVSRALKVSISDEDWASLQRSLANLP